MDGIHCGGLHPAWQLLLQQPQLLQQQQACTLLCVSKAMAACLHAVAAGQMLCKICDSWCSRDDSAAGKAALAARLQSFSCWLPKNCRLLQSLDLDAPDTAVNAAGIPAAMQQAAAAAAHGNTSPSNPMACTAAARSSSSSSSSSAAAALQLQSFRGPLVAPLLQQLPGHSLTSLTIADDDAAKQTDSWELAARARRSLCHLTKLQRLVLIEEQETNANLLVPALANMQQLTFLDIGIARGRPQELHHLPASLLELKIGAESNGFEEPDENWERPLGNFNFAHLTALTKLSLEREVGEELLPIDVLPPSLVELHCGSVPSPEPLLHLQQLRLLSMREQMSAAGLRQLGSTLTALQGVDLCYWHCCREAAAAAESWSCLPVRSLDVSADGHFDLPCLRHIAGLTGLRKLVMRVSSPVAWTGSDVAAVLGGLKQLENFELCGGNLGMHDGTPSTQHPLNIVQAAAGLPQLRSLQLEQIEVGRQAAMQLSVLSQLTSLELPFCELVDFDVIVLALNLTALRALDISYNKGVGDSVLPVIARNLQQLTSLKLMHTNVSSLGLQWLREMQHLGKIGVCHRLVTSPALAGTNWDVDEHACDVCAS